MAESRGNTVILTKFLARTGQAFGILEGGFHVVAVLIIKGFTAVPFEHAHQDR